jgi:hypothetical protein
MTLGRPSARPERFWCLGGRAAYVKAIAGRRIGELVRRPQEHLLVGRKINRFLGYSLI